MVGSKPPELEPEPPEDEPLPLLPDGLVCELPPDEGEEVEVGAVLVLLPPPVSGVVTGFVRLVGLSDGTGGSRAGVAEGVVVEVGGVAVVRVDVVPVFVEVAPLCVVVDFWGVVA